MNKSFAFAIAALSLSSLHGEETFLRNGGFEIQDFVFPSKAESWGVWGAALERVTDWEPTVEGVAMIAYKHWELSQSHGASSGIFQDAFDVKAGVPYELTIHCFADLPEWGSLEGSLEVRLESTIQGEQVFLNRKRMPFEAFLGEWKPVSIRATPSVNNLRAVVEFYPAAGSHKGGAVKIDLSRLIKLTPGTDD